MKIAAAFLILTFISVVNVSAEIYKYVDENGSVHFSDTPMHQESKKISVFDSDGGKVKSSANAQNVDNNSKQQPSTSEFQPNSNHSITAKDYNISSRAERKGDYIVVSGRISGGPECDYLTLTFFAHSEDGGIEQLTTVVKNVGSFGSKLFEARTKMYPEHSGSWYVSSTHATCQ